VWTDVPAGFSSKIPFDSNGRSEKFIEAILAEVILPLLNAFGSTANRITAMATSAFNFLNVSRASGLSLVQTAGARDIPVADQSTCGHSFFVLWFNTRCTVSATVCFVIGSHSDKSDSKSSPCRYGANALVILSNTNSIGVALNS